MAQATITQLRHLVRTLNYLVSTHAAEELEDDNLSILDLENIVLTGKLSKGNATREPVKSSTSSPVSRSTARPPKLLPKPLQRENSLSSLSSLSISVDHGCAHCGSAELQLKYVTRSFGQGASLLVIEAIPMWACPGCGETYFTAQTMHEIDRIKALRKSVAVNRSVAVAAFEAANA